MYGEHNATHIKAMPNPGVFRQSGTQVRGGKGVCHLNTATAQLYIGSVDSTTEMK